MWVISIYIVAHREENPWSCRDSEAIPVPAPASPRLNKVAKVITLIGSLFCLSISWSQCKYITSAEWYKIFGITATKTQNSWLWLKPSHLNMGLAQYVNKSTNPQPLAQSNFCHVSIGYQLSGNKGEFYHVVLCRNRVPVPKPHSLWGLPWVLPIGIGVGSNLKTNCKRHWGLWPHRREGMKIITKPAGLGRIRVGMV